MPVLNDYLNQRYGGFTNQGVAENRIDTWGPLARYNATSVSRGRMGRAVVPEAVADLPTGNSIEQYFAQQSIEKQNEGGGEWPIFGPVLRAGKVALDALSAGEYAVASTIREIVDQKRQSDDVNPVNAFFKGLAAGFSSDEEYKTTMYDVLTSMGWDPDTTSGKVGKAMLGFGLSMAVDPLSYTGLGALKTARAGRFATKDVKGVIDELAAYMPASLKRASAGDQYFNKAVGQPILDHFKKFRRESTVGLSETERMLKGVEHDKHAIEDTFLSAVPLGTDTWQEAYKLKERTIGGKVINLVDETLNFLGKPLTDANKEWWITKGGKTAFDPGGVVIGIPFTEFEGHLWPNKDIFGPKYLGAIGGFLATAVRKGIPFAERGEKALKGTSLYKAFDASMESMKQRFQSMRGESATERLMQGELKVINKRVSSDARLIAAGAVTVDATPTATRFGPTKMTIGKGGKDVLTPGEDKLVNQLLFDIRHHFKEGAMNDLPAWLKKVLIDQPDIAFKQRAKNLNVPLNQKTVDRMAAAIGNARSIDDQVLKIGHSIGKPIDPVEFHYPFYSAVDVEGSRKFFHDRTGKGIPLDDPATHQSLTGGMRFHEIMARKIGFGQGEIAAHPLDSFRETIERQVTIALRDAAYSDTFSKFGGMNMLHGSMVSGKGAKEFDPFVKEYNAATRAKGGTQLNYMLAETSKGKYAGMSKEKGPMQLWQELRRATTKKDVTKAISDMEVPKGITDANLLDIRKDWESTKSLLEKEISAGATSKSPVLQEMRDMEAPFFNSLAVSKMETLLKNSNDNITRQIASVDIATGKPVGTAADIAAQGKVGDQLQRLANDVTKRAKSLGVERHLPALLEKIGFTGDATKANIAELTRLSSVLRSEKPNRWIQDLLRPGSDFVNPTQLAKIKIKQIGNPSKMVPITDYVMDPKIIHEMQQYISPQNMGEMAGAAYKVLGFATNNLKKLLTGAVIPGVIRPAFHIRNFLDQGFKRTFGLSAEAGLAKPENIVSTIKMMLGKSGSREFYMKGSPMSYEGMLQQFETLTTYNQKWMDLGAEASDVEDMLKVFSTEGATNYALKRQAFLAKFEKLSAAKKALDPNTAGSLIDNFFVIESMLAQSDRGIPFAQAAENVRRSLFDYSNLTDFEKKLSSLVMFYGFQRQALPFVLRQLAEKPVLFNAMARVRDLNWDSPQEEALVPPWVKDYPHIRMEAADGKIKVASLRNMFTLDSMADLFPMGVKEFVAKLNPMITLPVELAVGRDIYMNQDLKEVKYIKEAMSKVPEWIPFLNARTVNAADGKDYFAVDAYPWHIMRRTWFSRMFRDADNLAKTVSGDITTWQSLMNFSLGVKLYEYDIEKQMSFLQMDANKAKSAYDSALRKGDRLAATRILDELRKYTRE